MKLPPLTPSAPLHLQSQPIQTPMSKAAPEQVLPTTDLHKMAMSIAMSNLLKRKRPQ
jgi:hypothetical protein